MPRKRKLDAWLPERVYRNDAGSYRYNSRSGDSQVIADKDATREEVIQAYEQLINDDATLKALWEMYRVSDRFTQLAPKTRDDYAKSWKTLSLVFGSVDAKDIESHHIRRYMDLRPAKVAANRERSLLNNLMRFGIEYNWVSHNPVPVVKPNKETPRTKYVTEDEYQEMYDRVPGILQVFMELTYICAARSQDIRLLKMSDILDDGLLVYQEKTGKKQLMLWNARLRSAIDRALEIRKARLDKRGHQSMFLIVTTTGGPYTGDGLRTNWQKKKYPGMDWTLHDLKAKGISDFEGDKQALSGHKSRLMVERYNRTPDKTEVIDFSRVKK